MDTVSLPRLAMPDSRFSCRALALKAVPLFQVHRTTATGARIFILSPLTCAKSSVDPLNLT